MRLKSVGAVALGGRARFHPELKMALETHRVTPFLWYDGQAEEAARFYVSVFKRGSRVTSVSPMSVTFELEGQPFIALNGGPIFKFSEAVSLFVDCKDQREVDYYWRKLGDGGQPGRCGWLKDRWGLSWQVVPRILGECLGGSDRSGARRAMDAMLGMGKLDVKALRAAYQGKPAGGPAPSARSRRRVRRPNRHTASSRTTPPTPLPPGRPPPRSSK